MLCENLSVTGEWPQCDGGRERANPPKRVCLLPVSSVQKAREIWQSQGATSLQINGSEVDFLHDILKIA